MMIQWCRTVVLAFLVCLGVPAGAEQLSADDELLGAILSKDIEGARTALAHGADPNCVYHLEGLEGATPLMAALGTREAQMTLLLLEKGANPGVKLVGEGMRVPALNVALKSGDPALLSKMIEHGADPAATDESGNTVLTEAASAGQEDMIRALIASGVSPNQIDGRQRTALQWAVMMNNVSLVKALLELGADPNLAGTDGLTPMKAARKKHNGDIIAVLQKAGAK